MDNGIITISEERIHSTTEIEKLKKEINIYKKILEDVFEKHGELCSLCEKKGRCLPECSCMTTEECMDTLFILYEGEK